MLSYNQKRYSLPTLGTTNIIIIFKFATNLFLTGIKTRANFGLICLLEQSYPIDYKCNKKNKKNEKFLL